jgi:hypothetical protein
MLAPRYLHLPTFCTCPHSVLAHVLYLPMLCTCPCSRYLHLPMFCAERAWAYAMQLKAEGNTEPRKRFHMASRLRKAVQYAEQLATLCESPKCDARTKLETQVQFKPVLCVRESVLCESPKCDARTKLETQVRGLYRTDYTCYMCERVCAV